MQKRNNIYTGSRKVPIIKLFLFSSIGIFMFFIPLRIGERTTIPLDHIVTSIRTNFYSLASLYALIVIILGTVFPFIDKSWRRDRFSTIFSFLKIVGVAASLMYYFRFGPSWFLKEDMSLFLYEKLVIPVGIIVPVGSIFLSFLVDYGLLEFIGVFMRPIMRPIWKTSGRSAIDALASFVGSYSIGLLITNRVFKEGKYTIKEASIIATGFSTVSATFMIIVARTSGLMDMWPLLFFTTLFTTFLVTAVTVRLYPLKHKRDEYIVKKPRPEVAAETSLLKHAVEEGIKTAASSSGFGRNLACNLRDGFKMTAGILPSIMSIGLIGLVLAKYTVLFNLLGYLFFPITWLFNLPEPMLAAKAVGLGISEMFLPPLFVTQASMITRYVVSVVSVSSILFFSASIPCILSTEIPITIPEILMIWFERSVISLVVASLFAILIL